jgi:SpoVK/Ycf46/Vps4 family AAA+-type ATPase
VGGKRKSRDANYHRQTLNQLLNDLDGFDQSTGVIFIAATNHPELLDAALLRPGRFDRHVQVELPDVGGRLAILKYHTKKIRLNPEIDLSSIARGTPGFSGAELENLANSAAIRASKLQAKFVGLTDLEWAKDKIMKRRRAQSLSRTRFTLHITRAATLLLVSTPRVSTTSTKRRSFLEDMPLVSHSSFPKKSTTTHVDSISANCKWRWAVRWQRKSSLVLKT